MTHTPTAPALPETALLRGLVGWLIRRRLPLRAVLTGAGLAGAVNAVLTLVPNPNIRIGADWGVAIVLGGLFAATGFVTARRALCYALTAGRLDTVLLGLSLLLPLPWALDTYAPAGNWIGAGLATAAITIGLRRRDPARQDYCAEALLAYEAARRRA